MTRYHPALIQPPKAAQPVAEVIYETRLVQALALESPSFFWINGVGGQNTAFWRETFDRQERRLLRPAR